MKNIFCGRCGRAKQKKERKRNRHGAGLDSETVQSLGLGEAWLCNDEKQKTSFVGCVIDGKDEDEENAREPIIYGGCGRHRNEKERERRAGMACPGVGLATNLSRN